VNGAAAAAAAAAAIISSLTEEVQLSLKKTLKKFMEY